MSMVFRSDHTLTSEATKTFTALEHPASAESDSARVALKLGWIKMRSRVHQLWVYQYHMIVLVDICLLRKCWNIRIKYCMA